MEEICVLVAKEKRKSFKRYDYNRRVIEDFNLALNIYTVFCPKSAFTKRRLKKICSKYSLVYSKDVCFKKYCKSKEDSILNYIPDLAISFITKNMDLSENAIGIVIKSNKLVNINFLSALLKNVKYINIYNPTSESKKAILDATGICATNGKDYSERLIIYLGENLSFFVDGEYITDVNLSGHSFLEEISFPAAEILKDYLKQPQSRNIMEKAGIYINSLHPLDKTY